MAWGRVVKLEARNKDGVQVEISGGLPESGNYPVRLDARCVRSRVFDDNELEATIRNASPDTINKFLQRGTNIALYAGYSDEGELGLMYQGNILDSKTYRSGADTLTIIRSVSLRSLTRPFTATPVCLSFKPGSNAGQVVDAIAALLGLVPTGKEMAAEVKLNSGWTFVGPVSQALKRLKQDLRPNGIGMYIDLAELVVFKYKGDSTYSISYLSPDTGLLNLQDTTDYIGAAHSDLASLAAKSVSEATGVSVDDVKLKPEDTDDAYAVLDRVFTNMKKTYSARTIVIPKLRPNSLVHISHPETRVDGLFVVDRMEVAVGNGADSSFAMDLNLVEA